MLAATTEASPNPTSCSAPNSQTTPGTSKSVSRRPKSPHPYLSGTDKESRPDVPEGRYSRSPMVASDFFRVSPRYRNVLVIFSDMRQDAPALDLDRLQTVNSVAVKKVGKERLLPNLHAVEVYALGRRCRETHGCGTGSKDPGCHCLKKGRNLGGTIAFRRNQAGSHTNST